MVSRVFWNNVVSGGVAIIVGWFLWFVVVPSLTGFVFLPGFAPVFEALFDGALLGLLFWFFVSLGFWVFGGD